MTSRSSALVDVQLGLVQALAALRLAAARDPGLQPALGATRDLLEDHLKFVGQLARRWDDRPLTPMEATHD
ncbi:MAG: hypothetical protein R3F58_09395 [Steroidobacteraceae bacterium]